MPADFRSAPVSTGPAVSTAAPVPASGPAHEVADDGSYPIDEPSLRSSAGLARGAVILACRFDTSPPMQPLTDAWALHVVALEIATDRPTEIELFAGYWLDGPVPAENVEGYLVVRLHPPAARPGPTPNDDPAPTPVDVELLLAYQGQWVSVGMWPGLDTRWPRIVAPTAAAIRRLHTDQLESGHAADLLGRESAQEVRARVRAGRRRRPGLTYLLEAGLVSAGDELEWVRRRMGVRHAARVRADGRIELADGRAFLTPSQAVTALGAPDSSGWRLWRRVRDDRSLGDIRAEYLAQQRSGPTAPTQR